MAASSSDPPPEQPAQEGISSPDPPPVQPEADSAPQQEPASCGTTAATWVIFSIYVFCRALDRVFLKDVQDVLQRPSYNFVYMNVIWPVCWDGNGLAYPHRTGFSYDKQTSVKYRICGKSMSQCLNFW